MNTKTVSFSIIMPTYNRAFCIENTIHHILAQSYQDFELIIIDDGSNDNTDDLISNIFSTELQNGKIKYHKLSRNSGVCTARNIGLSLATKNWIAYCDTDNWMRPNFLASFADAILRNPKSKTFYSQIQHKNTGRIIGHAFNYAKLCISNFIDMGVFCHHKDLVAKYGGFDTNLRRLVDWDLILTYTKKHKPVFIEKVLLDYNDSNSFNRITNSETQNIEYIYKKHKINLKSGRHTNMPYKIFYKERCPNGRRHIYFCGIKILSYKKKKHVIHWHNNKIIIIENGVERILKPKEKIRGLNINIRGNNNTVKLEFPINAIYSNITIENDNVYVELGASPHLCNLNIDCRCGNGQICKIGSGTTVYGANIKLAEQSGCIIGTDCMFSNSINIWTTDGHSIIDARTNEITNTATNPVIIGNHVWIGEGARITKRAHIYDNSIVGGGAVCYKDYKESNVIIAGNPGEIIKRNITWDRSNPYVLQQARQEKINSIPHIDRNEIDKKIKMFAQSGVDDSRTHKPRIIVSLTSFPQRMSDIHYALFSLLNQTLKPDMIVLWLGTDKFPNREKDLPESVQQMTKHGITIKWCKDIRSYTKLIYALKEFPYDIIITVDDDIYYPEYLIEKLYNAYMQEPKHIHCLRAHKIIFSKRKEILPYNKWTHCTREYSASYLNFLTGVGGVLYPPKSLDKDVFNQEQFQRLAPLADDVWFWAMAVKNGTKINVVKSDFKCVYINPERELQLNNETTLAAQNVTHAKNDEQLYNVIKYTGIKLG